MKRFDLTCKGRKKEYYEEKGFVKFRKDVSRDREEWIDDCVGENDLSEGKTEENFEIWSYIVGGRMGEKNWVEIFY